MKGSLQIGRDCGEEGREECMETVGEHTAFMLWK